MRPQWHANFGDEVSRSGQAVMVLYQPPIGVAFSGTIYICDSELMKKFETILHILEKVLGVAWLRQSFGGGPGEGGGRRLICLLIKWF